MIRKVLTTVTLLTSMWSSTGLAEDTLARAFANPPASANAWCYWWWLNGAASKEGITRDFEEMRRQGISGALLFDAGEAGPPAPRGPAFMSPEWRELFRHAVREADRCGVALGVNLCSGWDCGGAWITAEHAAKNLVAATTLLEGPGAVSVDLPQPTTVDGYYRDVAVLACRLSAHASLSPRLAASSHFPQYPATLADDGSNDTRWISNSNQPGSGPTPEKPEFIQFDYDHAWPAAGLYLKPYQECGPKDIEIQSSTDGQTYRPIHRTSVGPNEEAVISFDETTAAHFRVMFLSSQPYQGQENWNVQVAEISLLSSKELKSPARGRRVTWHREESVDLSERLDSQGHLRWDVPDGRWRVMRIGYTLHGNMTKCVGGGPAGPEIDPMSAAAMDAHFAATGAPLIADAGPLAGTTLQYFHIDSWEIGQPTWTPELRGQFQQRRGYDPLFFLPAVMGEIVDDVASTARFLHDFRRTAADLIATNFYGRLHELALAGGLRGTHPESGGPFFAHWIDALECEGINDIPMGEFWKRNTEPDGPVSWDPDHNPSVKQAASAAHIYGKSLCQAEAFTAGMFVPDWTATPWNMKDIGDEAFCHGLTRFVLCFWVHQPQMDVRPGFQWVHVGTHFDPYITWWNMSHGWLKYIARCQQMLRQGRFVADFAYFQGEEIPGFIAPRNLQQPPRPAGFDYDAMNAPVLLNRAEAQDGRLVLPDGMSYRYLVLPHNVPWNVSPNVLRKIKQLAEDGVTVIGPPPMAATGLTDCREHDRQVRELVSQLWGAVVPAPGSHSIGSGRLISGMTLDEIVTADGLPPDVEFCQVDPTARLDWIHRTDTDGEIYFLSNQSAVTTTAVVAFRLAGKQPELWDAVTGRIRNLPEWRVEAGRTIVPLSFAPRESYFVVFRTDVDDDHSAGGKNFPTLHCLAELAGSWELSFDPAWGGPGSIMFDQLEDWTRRSEDGIRYYSGTVGYRKTFDLPNPNHDPAQPLYLDLGTVHELASIRLNGHQLGVVWTAPWRVEITDAVKPTGNQLEIDVVNLWPNRLIGDTGMPPEQRFTVTNVDTYQQDSPLLPSGLLGPVTVTVADRAD